MTNSRAGARLQSQGGGGAGGERRHGGGSSARTSQWIIDGDELPRAAIEVRWVWGRSLEGGRGRVGVYRGEGLVKGGAWRVGVAG